MKAPIRHTCPDIDRIVKSVNWCMTAIQQVADELDAIRINTEDDSLASALERLISVLEDAKREASIEDDMEQLRYANASLRDWGYQLLQELETVQA